MRRDVSLPLAVASHSGSRLFLEQSVSSGGEIGEIQGGEGVSLC